MRAFVLLSIGLLAGCNCTPGGSGPPTVRIITPSDWSYLDGPGPHDVVGEAIDPDEVLSPDDVVWRSDKDGTVGRSAITSITLSPGEHRLTLEATDRDGNVGSAQVTVFVRFSTDPDGGTPRDGGVGSDGGVVTDGGVESDPVATIAAPANGAFFDEGMPIELRGSATDAEDGALTGGALVWTSDRAGVIGTGARLMFSNASLGAHRVVLTATDRSGRFGIASISLTVVRPGTNRPPAVTISSPTASAQLTVGVAASLQGSAVDPEDGALTGSALRWTSSLDGVLGTGTALSPLLTQGVHILTLAATDSMGAMGSAAVTVSVNQPNNQPPTATITQPASMQTLFQGSSLTFAGTGQDPEDGALTGMALSWTSSIDGALGTGSPFSTSALTTGDHTVTFVARDSGGNTGTASIVVRVLPQNQPPSVVITAPMTGHSVAAGSMVTFTGSATDPEDGALSGSAVRWNSSRDGALGTGATFTTGSLSVGVHTITFSAIDSGGRSASTSIVVTVTMSTMNVPPLARLTGPSAGQATDVLNFDGSSSSDSDGTVVSYRFDFGDGSTPVTSAMGTATHAFAMAGTYTVTLTVTDDRGATSSATLSVTIATFVRVPVIALPANGDVGDACAIATPGSRVFLAWTGVRHPAVFFGERVGSTLQVEVVDGLGFNTGGFITQHVAMQVEANGTPHLVYVRDFTVMYATKVGGAWVRERVDAVGMAYSNVSSSLRDETDPSIALAGSTPSVLFLSGLGTVGSPYRPVVAVRTGANAWTRTVVAPNNPTSSSGFYPWGELVIDGSGRHLFPAKDDTSPVNNNQLVAWTSSARSSVAIGAPGLNGRHSMALASATRLYLLGADGVMDVQLADPLSGTTMQRSLVEMFGTSQHGLAVDQAGLPRLVVNHAGELEAVRPATSPGFWIRHDLGRASTGLIDASVDGANETRACFVRAGNLMLY